MKKWICGKYYNLTPEDHDKLFELLKPGYYIILTRRNTHLTTYLIALASRIKEGKFAHYTHALMNCNNEKVRDKHQLTFIEATGKGVGYSFFDQVLDCDSVCLLKPKNVDETEWIDIIDKMYQQYGKEYDTVFDLSESDKLSCVEMVRVALMADPNYEKDFSDFEAMIKKYGNLTPQLFRDSPDFEVVLEIKR